MWITGTQSPANACYNSWMTDTASHVAAQPAEARHTLTVREVEAHLANAGVQRSHRHVLRLCQAGTFDAVKIPGASGEEWYVSPASVPKAIGDLKQIDEQRARRSPAQPAVSDNGAVKPPLNKDTEEAGHGAPQPDVSAAENNGEQRATQHVMAGHSASKSDMAHQVAPNEQLLAHYVALIENNIYEHPYVKRLEHQVDKLEAKYEAQVMRTEQIQIESQDKILELQRMTTVGHSQILADLMLKAKSAKDWVLGNTAGNENVNRGEPEPTNP